MANIREMDRAKFTKYCTLRNFYSSAIASGSDNDLFSAHQYGNVNFKQFYTPHLSKNNFNNHSIVTVLEYNGIKVIVPGDNEYDSLEELMKNEAFKEAITNSDILLAPHHGRESAYHNDFVSLANPRITIVSDGSVCDTSATGRYSQKSRGWGVYYNNRSEYIERKCLTTNSDGEVYVSFGPSNDPQYRNFLTVQIM